WDSYGGKAIDPGCAWDAYRLLATLLSDESPAPALVPTKKGGVQVEWHAQGVDLEIEIVSPGRYRISAEDSRTGETWEEETAGPPAKLRDWLARISPHAPEQTSNGGDRR